jgi:hypothetical protein
MHSHSPEPRGRLQACAHLCAPSQEGPAHQAVWRAEWLYRMESSFCFQARGTSLDSACWRDADRMQRSGHGLRGPVGPVPGSVLRLLPLPSQEPGQPHNSPAKSEEAGLLVKCVTEAGKGRCPSLKAAGGSGSGRRQGAWGRQLSLRLQCRTGFTLEFFALSPSAFPQEISERQERGTGSFSSGLYYCV